MRANRSESGLERRPRSELHRRGLRFRKNFSVLPGVRCRPDVVFGRAKLAVFVDGCFWHRCPVHGSEPRSNSAWWRSKLEGNVVRDRRNDAVLSSAGWRVLRLWEHEPLAEMADQVYDELLHARRRLKT
jgi:DNA mismatch endonuclease (patch repair protein)